MKLFKDITIKEKLINFEIPELEKKLAIIKEWLEDYHQGSLKTDKETSRAGGYNQAIFSDVLGYVRKPSPQATFDAEYSLQGKFPDGVLGYFHADEKKEDNVCAVVELKGANIPLDQPQKREKNYTPIEQGFGYKRLLRDCPFVVVSNFYELRLYNDNEIDYEIWTLDNLVDPTDDYFNFKKFYYLLCADHLIAETGLSKTESLMSDIRLEEQEITKKFYADYKSRRHLLLQNLYQKNESLRDDPDLLIEMGQKLIDRVIFMCFAEDCGLLPADILQTIKRDFEQSSMVASVWDSLKIAFNYVNKGNDNWGIPDGYNGGLFARDDRFDDLKIEDHILSKIIDFGMYDFVDQLSVTILGHIFEQSISDLEEIKEKINDLGKTGNEVVATKTSKRKKDGIFYTPEYIVDYIVKNSLGTYLREHEIKYIEEENLHDELSTKEYKKREQIVYTKYQEFLKTVTVLDPACGSGAFLVRVFDYLLEENRRVGKILGGLFNTDETYKSILQNNIYGVDLNAESVEITKLSLWLKSAQKNKKLSNLDNNIKCGNSLIDDPAVAGDKAFKWEEEFKDIIDNGGFDVIVGNPPYVRQEFIKEYSGYLLKKYDSYSGKADLFTYFFEKSLNILKQDGLVSFISSGKFFEASYGKPLVNFIVGNSQIVEVIDFKDLNIFDGISAYPLILTLRKNKSQDYLFNYKDATSINVDKLNQIVQGIKFDQINIKDFVKNDFKFFNIDIANIISKIKLDSKTLKDMDLLPLVGVKTGYNDGFVGIETKYSRKYIFGRDIKKYSPVESREKIFFPYSFHGSSYNLVNDDTKELSLLSQRNKLEKRAIIKDGIIDGSKKWYEFQQINKKLDFDQEYIVYPNVSLGSNFTFSKGSVIDMTGFIIPSNSKYLLTILNSRLIVFYMELFAISRRGGYLEYKTQYLSQVPFKDISQTNQQPFIKKADIMLDLNKKFYEQSSRFLQRMIDNYGLEKANKKLEKFWELDFGDFVKEMRKKGADVPLSTQDELQDYFDKNKSELLALDLQIKTTDAEIDTMVYKLYDLTDEEIEIIENS